MLGGCLLITRSFNLTAMKTILSIITNYRYYVITLLAMASIILIACDVDNSVEGFRWAVYLISSKIAGALVGWLCIRLAKYWELRGEIVF